MKIAKKQSINNTPLVNPIIGLARPSVKTLKMNKYKAIKCHNTLGDVNSCTYKMNLLYYRGRSSKEWLL